MTSSVKHALTHQRPLADDRIELILISSMSYILDVVVYQVPDDFNMFKVRSEPVLLVGNYASHVYLPYF